MKIRRFLVTEKVVTLTKMQQSCISKGVFHHRKAAMGAANTLAKTLERPIRFYKCPICRDFHLTSDPNPPKKSGRFARSKV